MKTKVLVIGVVENDDKVLMRKKPKGAPPYKESWYLFGGELTPNKTAEEAIREQVKKQTNIEVSLVKSLSWDTEVKEDLDNKTKMFIYLDTLCEYQSGDLEILDPGIEELKWIPKKDIPQYDIVPPAKKLFKKLGYIQ